ncbi:hypothetical protein GGI25_000135 [Coemansia spiralis]|uniref:DUF4211 domain-containing protein n=2 Tax=Coemansia TaxID=4863 RepID=A0A9W8GCV9_9FUNG|nr:hypothetical protein EDC05_002781 [Coemansia umbellata]KAJ2621793.1 hypothetical protein GGI26_003773 [Coemansia sp. RSA 1358]KAJ2681180.1 hypothetical protein GGI25_000135 [Coemansia spiralis]
MFSDSGSDSGEVDDFYAAGEEKRDERDSSIEEVAEAVSQPKRSYNTQRLFPPRMDFMDEESARNYRQILAKNRKNTGRTIKDPKELIKGHDRSTNHQHLSEIDEAVSSDELPDSALSVVEPTNNIINTGARRTSRPRTLQISDSEATDDPDALDERAILNHRLRSSKTSSRPSLSRFEQARLRLRQPPKVLDTDNSDYEIDDVSEKEAQTHSQFVDDIENTSSDDSSKMDILETESDTNHHTRNSVLVIRDSSDEGDEDFISETEETYLASKPTSSDTKMGKFLTVFEPRRRRYMQQKLTMRRRTTDTTDTNLPSKSKVKSPKSKVKLAKGYSQELDDDLADFIVDDDEIEKDEQSNAIGESENEEARSIWRSAHKDYGSDIELSDGSEKSAAPKLGLGGRDDLKDLMPEEFSQFDLPTSFKAYVQYLVYWLRNGHKKPAMSNKNARYFFFAYITVSRVIDSVEQSLVDSSAWVDKFRRDLHSYPEIQISRITAIQGCDACHFRKNRTATFCICLLGKPYNRDILIPPRPGESVIATSARIQSDSESINSDSDFESLSPRREQRNVKYNVGRTCKQRSKVGHELHHYFYHLSTLVEIALSTLAFSDIENVDTTTATWEEADPDDLVDLMDSQGIIDKLYAGFKDLVSRSKSGFAS